jgi:hypothetical protein
MPTKIPLRVRPVALTIEIVEHVIKPFIPPAEFFGVIRRDVAFDPTGQNIGSRSS